MPVSGAVGNNGPSGGYPAVATGSSEGLPRLNEMLTRLRTHLRAHAKQEVLS